MPAPRRGLSIQQRLLMLVIAAALPPLLFSVVQARNASAVERDNAEQRALQLARRIATRVDDHVNTVDALLVALSHTVVVDTAAIQRNDSFLRSVSRDLGDRFLHLSVADRTGRVVGISAPGGTRRIHVVGVSDRRYFRDAMASRGLGVGDLMIGRVSNEYSIALGRAVIGPKGKPIGVVAASTLLAQLEAILVPKNLPAEAVVTLQDAHGTVLARTMDAEHWVGRDVSGLRWTPADTAATEGVLEVRDMDGVPRLAAYASATRAPWRVDVGIPSAIALARVHASGRTASLLGLASLAVALFLAGLMAHGIAAPVRALTADADAFAAGDLARRVQVHGDGELGVLASTFNRMADALQRRTDQLSESEMRYRTVFDTMPLPMWVFDRETLRFLTVNAAAVARYGYTRDEFLGMTVGDLRPEEDRQRFLESLAERAREPNVREASWRHVTRSGEMIHVEISADDVAYGESRARLVVANDVTERERTEAALRTSQEQLRQSQKLEAIGSLAGGIAHDFNNLLTAILGYCDLALDAIPADSKASEDVLEVRRAAQRAAELTHQLLAFSRRQMLKPRVFALAEAVRETEKILRRLISENIALELLVEGNETLVCVDRTQLEQVILNLAVNARDAMPRGGTLRLATGAIELDSPVAAAGSIIAPGRYALLTVTDTGTGIPPEIRDRLFEPFFTTKARGQGTGLGLATVYGIMQQSGGAVQITSAVGAGTTFALYFPMADPDGERQDEVDDRHDADARGQGTILLTEDDDAVRAIARETLERAGYRVLPARHGADALAVAESYDDPIDLLVTDVIMPGMNGRELAQTLSRRRTNIRVLFASGYTYNVLAGQDALTPGMMLLDKPFTPAELVAKVRDVLGGVYVA
jgi:PAS domain S-box-containing protein